MQSEVQERWLEARERMRRRIDAGLWQDIGISSPERARYVDWILDEIFKDEYVACSATIGLFGAKMTTAIILWFRHR